MHKVVLTFWRRKVGVGVFVALAAMAAFVVYSIVQGDRGWFVGAAGTVVILATIFMCAMFVNHYRAAMARLEQMKPPVASLLMSEEGFTISSSAGTSTLRWSAITDIWEQPKFWLVFVSKAQFVTLPTTEMPESNQQLFKQRATDARGKVA
jgi:hypothetical protein